MSDDEIDIAWATIQIKELVNKFEDKKLPIWAVGAIHGYCNIIVQRALDNILKKDAANVR